MDYPVRSIIPSSTLCPLSEARWGVCWVNFQALIISIAVVAGLLLLTIAGCCCYCCYCRRRGRDRGRLGWKKKKDLSEIRKKKGCNPFRGNLKEKKSMMRYARNMVFSRILTIHTADMRMNENGQCIAFLKELKISRE
uniref:GekBS090P n=1 Tax=Gekko japonicus TaxID=146911 RepID=Q5EI61_GEKJA|nr:GekBS090P [Gekko japonicus]